MSGSRSPIKTDFYISLVFLTQFLQFSEFMKRVPETAAAINAKDPSQLAPALLEVLEVALLPEELPHTRVLIKELLNPKNENEFLQHEIIVLISLAKEKTWLVDIPLWCLSRFLKGPRDDIFSKGLADLHKEVHKTLQENEVGSFIVIFMNSFFRWK